MQMDTQDQDLVTHDQDLDDSVKRYKAHLVSKGFTEEYGIDYEKIFVLVTELITIRTFIVVVAEK